MKKLLFLLPLMTMLLSGCSKTQTGQLKAGETLVVYVDSVSHSYYCEPGHTYKTIGGDGTYQGPSSIVNYTEPPQIVKYKVYKDKIIITYSRCSIENKYGCEQTSCICLDDYAYSSYQVHTREYVTDLFYGSNISYSIHNSNNQ